MADIFISYKKEDAGRVIRMVEALRAEGFDVWWDHGIKAGTEWDRSIHKELYAAKVVIAIWSNASVAAPWVKEEATVGKSRGVLVFIPILYRVRREGALEVAGMAADYGRAFQKRWLDEREHTGRELGLDVQSLAAMIQSYRETVNQMRVLIFDKNDVIRLLLATLLPAIPVMVMHVPREDWRGLLELLTGGWIR